MRVFCKAALFLNLLFFCLVPVFGNGSNGLVVLLTDYGSQDFYLGAIKGVIYKKFPEARVDTITSEVPPFNIREGAYLLARAAVEFPAGTVFCAVVDPGVGTKRRSIAVETEDGKLYVAPDNGLLTLVLHDGKVKGAYEITNPLFMRDSHPASSTFQGRDIYAPAAAQLAKGIPIAMAGPPVKDWVTFKVAEPAIKDKEITGEVEHVDGYGNIITNIPGEFLRKLGLFPGKMLSFDIGSEFLEAPLVKSYADVREGSWLVLENGNGVLEIARNQASANAFLQVHAGTLLRLRW